MDFFQLLLLAHIIGDFTLQTDAIFRLKKRSLWGVPLHVLICSLVNAAVFFPLLPHPQIWVVIIGLALAHFALDRTKLLLTVIRVKDGLGYFFIDQALHLLSLLGAAWYLQHTLPMTVSWIDPHLVVRLTAVNIAAFAAPPIIFYFHHSIAAARDAHQQHHFPTFEQRLPGILARALAVAGLLAGSWYNLLALLLLYPLWRPQPTPDHHPAYRITELLCSASITLFAALIAWYLTLA